MRFFLIAGLMFLAGVACGGTVSPQTESPTSVPDPRIDDLMGDLKQLSERVEELAGTHDSETAQLRERVEGIASQYQEEIITVWGGLADLAEILEQMATPAYWPTIADYEVAITVAGSKLQRTNGVWSLENTEGYDIRWWDVAVGQYDSFTAVYVAAECLDGGELSAERFQSFVEQTVFWARDGIPIIQLSAEKVIGDIILRHLYNEALIEEGEPVVENACERRYLYPETGAEASLVITPVGVIRPYFRNSSTGRQHAFRCFDPELGAGDRPGDKTFLQWICGDSGEVCRVSGD